MSWSVLVFLLYIVLPAFAACAYSFLKKHKPTIGEIVPIIATTIFWVIALVCAIGAFKNGLQQGKDLYAISTAAFTVSLTIYGEMFNGNTGDTESAKISKSRIKSGIAIFRALILFVFTLLFFKG